MEAIRARSVSAAIVIAQNEASMLGQGECGVEALLAGLIFADKDVREIINGRSHADITLEGVRDAMMEVVGKKCSCVSMEDVSQSPDVQRALDRALGIAHAFGTDVVLGKYLFYSILEQRSHSVDLMLERLGISSVELLIEANPSKQPILGPSRALLATT
jgi:ATP-dependent Clp protease ATP-binding subunit ClpA